MSKCILVMDMPSGCSECNFCRGLNVCRLKQFLEKDGVFSVFTVDKQILDNSRPDWCPLKPMPEKVETFNCEELCDVDDWYDSGYHNGYNACIDELLKGEEG